MKHHGEYKVIFRRVFCLNLLTEWMFVSLKKMEDNRPHGFSKSKFSFKHLEFVVPWLIGWVCKKNLSRSTDFGIITHVCIKIRKNR